MFGLLAIDSILTAHGGCCLPGFVPRFTFLGPQNSRFRFQELGKASWAKGGMTAAPRTGEHKHSCRGWGEGKLRGQTPGGCFKRTIPTPTYVACTVTTYIQTRKNSKVSLCSSAAAKYHASNMTNCSVAATQFTLGRNQLQYSPLVLVVSLGEGFRDLQGIAKPPTLQAAG